ncbi:hypothetical protein FA13DRAFT_550395 [Coprinellus micaceus]|uniref:CBM1 domain-containing protein n=1 Tax=Coprinellus micaceus TaxID=71717 RepID=A0A4Y7T895_COPMI|nr:hypothetical protein FA13DRAFT_550395 [Coprinellus micaceus]
MVFLFLSLLAATTVLVSWTVTRHGGGAFIVCSPTERIYTVAEPAEAQCMSVWGDWGCCWVVEDVTRATKDQWCSRKRGWLDDIVGRVPPCSQARPRLPIQSTKHPGEGLEKSESISERHLPPPRPS